MAHRFNRLAKKYVAPLWACVQSAISDLKELFAVGAEEAGRIARALHNADDMTRDALVRMAQELMVFPAKPREVSDGFVSVPIPPKAEMRPPVFRLGFEALEESVVWIKQSNIHQADCRYATPPADCALLNPPYTPMENFERRLLALEDVLAEPGRHAARVKRAMHKQDDDSGDPIILKDPDTVLLDHIDRYMGDPAYSDTDAFWEIHAQFFESS